MATSTCLRMPGILTGILLCSLMISVAFGKIPRQGILEKIVKNDSKISDRAIYVGFVRSAYANTTITLKANLSGEVLGIGWMIRGSVCYNEFSEGFTAKDYKLFYENPFHKSPDFSSNFTVLCPRRDYGFKISHEFLVENNDSNNQVCNDLRLEEKMFMQTPRSIDSEATEKFPNVTATVSKESLYLVAVKITPTKKSVLKGIKGSITVVFKDSDHHNYLSPEDYSMLIVYGILCAIYIIYAITWVVLLAMNWKDILRLQYWIAALILLGILEKALLLSEYDSVLNTGKSITGLVVVASLISCLKRSLGRILCIIASVGFGIVKPRLGPLLKKVLIAGGVYFIAAGVYQYFDVYERTTAPSNLKLASYAVTILIDAGILYWVFTNLLTTLRTLRLRRNIVKLSLYRHFTHFLLFAVLISVAYMVWWVITTYRQKCVDTFSLKILDDSFWPALFTCLLLVMIILWRPTINNQRYAFSPLLDHADDNDEDDDEEEIVINDAYEGMKLRATKEKPPKKDPQTKADEDLKWVEENIPTSLADTAIVIDSDDEVKQIRYEMGKMD